MSRVTRATSRAEAEIFQNNNKADALNSKTEVEENMNENMPAAATESLDESLKMEAQKPKQANSKAKTKKATGNRQPLGYIALNAVDDDVEKREKNAKEHRRSSNDKADSGGLDLSVGDETEIRVDDCEAVNGEEVVATEFMEPSVLEVVEEVDEDAGDKEAKETPSVGKEVESFGTNPTDISALEKMDLDSEFLRIQENSSEKSTQFEDRKANMDSTNGMRNFLTLKAENESSPNDRSSTVMQSPQLGRKSSPNPSKSTKRPEDSIEDMDAITAVIEEIGEALPCLDTFDSPVKLKKPNAEAAAANQSKVSKTPQGRLSIAKRAGPITKNDSVSRNAIQNAGHSSARRSNHSAQLSNNSTKRFRSSTSNITDKNRPSISTAPKTVDYLASRRPSINLKFPTPPSAPKNVKPRIVSDFKLPSDELAAKYRAQREERLKKELEEETARRSFKARPVPRSMSASVNTTTVGPRPTAATKARENLMREAKADIAPAEQDEERSQTKKKNSVMGITPSAKSLEKRRSMIIASTQHEKRAARRTSSIMPLQSQTASKRNSISAANGNSTSESGTKTASCTISDAATLRAKGREVFNRERLAKEEMERERRTKEEAARKARAEAAERGRQTSREWAEKQKQKMLEAKIKARVEAAKCA